MEQELLEETLRKLLPRDEGKPVEKPAEAGLRLRMYVLHTFLLIPQFTDFDLPTAACVDDVFVKLHGGKTCAVVRYAKGRLSL